MSNVVGCFFDFVITSDLFLGNNLFFSAEGGPWGQVD